ITSEIWLDAIGTTSWSYPMPAQINGQSYVVKARSVDKATNGSAVASNSFTSDVTGPTVTLDSIPDFVMSLPSIAGTSADAPPGLVDEVQVQIKNATDGTYWNGSSWVLGAVWLDAAGTTSWSYSMPSLVSNKSYEVKAKSIDWAGNESSLASDGFAFDNISPSVILSAIPEFANSLVSISGSASDTSPGEVQKVQVQIRNAADSTYWSGISWITSEIWLDASGTTSWSYPMPLFADGQSYGVKAKSVDKMMNESAVASDSFVFDVTGPTVILNSIPDLINSLPSIGGTSADTPPGQVDKVQIQIKSTADGTYWNGVSWVAGATWLDSWSYGTLLLISGQSYEVKAKSVDKATNESAIASDSFTFDTTSPTVTLNSIPDFVNLLPSVGGTSADSMPGQVGRVQVQSRNATDNRCWDGVSWVAGGIWLEATGTTSWGYSMPLLTTNKSYEVRAKSIDKATNESAIASDSFTFDNTDPTVVLSSIPDFVNSLPLVGGTSADAAPGQVDKVQVQIRNTTDDTCWDGSSWVAGDIWLDASGTTSWSYSTPSLASGNSYEVKARSIDKVANESTVATSSFIFNTTLPFRLWGVIAAAGVFMIAIVLIMLRRLAIRR
ncbi:MAG: Ig-like domain repeat protein, partial [Chloroflexi bacterium]|nr:Ig-like domain repeat protein [Chloroflexota bacterium]